jgi:hypothetical protein
MGSGRLKVLPLLVKYVEERKLYRRDDNGHIVKGRDHLQDAARCLMNGVSMMRRRPKPASTNPFPDRFGQSSWMVS